MDSDCNFTVYTKDNEKYIFVWREENRAELLRTFGRFATNRELSFSWLDACRASLAVRQFDAAGCTGR